MATAQISVARAQLAQAYALWSGAGAGIWSPYLRAVLAEATALDGDWEQGLKLVNESIEQTERPGWEECSHLAEILRLKGWMLREMGDVSGAEACIRAGLAHGRKQQAKSWELRCATSLAQILIERGERAQARDLLTPIYAWFTEGFETTDLKQARTLLEKVEAVEKPKFALELIFDLP